MRPDVRAWVVESRRKQGLPDYIEHAATLDELAAMVLESTKKAADDAAAKHEEAGRGVA